jgi:transcriptional regulator with XRE-family HTH domain
MTPLAGKASHAPKKSQRPHVFWIFGTFHVYKLMSRGIMAIYEMARLVSDPAAKPGGKGVMSMRFNEIGQQLRAYRMESGLKAEEISARLGVSRAALYRYEKGEVIKLDTVNRLAELLKISPLTLLGIGVEYYSKPVGYMERIRQIEETSDQILQVFGPICYLISSDQYDNLLAQIY